MAPSNEVRVPKKAAYWAIGLWIVVVCALALAVSAQAATWALSGFLALGGIAQLVLPRGVIPQVRSRLADAFTCLGLAALLAFFAPWAATPLII